MPILKIFAFAGLIILSIVSITAAQNSEVKLPETVAGQRVAAYLAAFNSGDEGKMRGFIVENVPEESLKQRPVGARLEVYRQMLGDIQSLSLRRIVESKPEKISILAQNKRGEWLKIDFMFESQAPNRLVGISINQTEAPGKETNLPANLTNAQFNNQLEDYLSKLVAADEFSGVVLIAKKDQPIFQKVVGLASKEFNAPNKIDTKFNLGSINKLFTQIAVAQLVAAGKLSYNDKIGKILPDYPNRDAAEKVTIKHLLTMTSGIGDFFGDKFNAISKDNLRGIKDYFPLFAAEPLQFEPGAKNQYSNGGYIVLGAIIEKLSNQTYYEYIRQNIFKPADMMNTDSYSTSDLVLNLAQGYTREEAKAHQSGSEDRLPQGYTREGLNSADKKMRRNNVLTRPARGSSAGGGYSTAEDMLKLSLALQSGKLREYDLSSPNGQAQKVGGLGIAGGSLGINANFEIDSEKGYTIIVLSNYDPPSATEVGKQIRSLLSRLNE